MFIGVIVCSICGEYDEGDFGSWHDGQFYCYDCEPQEKEIDETNN